jgi:aryl-alcohol dehydrogenase-like predicted oxidoreductase/histidinol phosphatase-like enzyme/predicted kinase
MMWPFTTAARPIGMGCMRLSTGTNRDEALALAVVHAALDAGVTLLDTADAYCQDESDVGHNERLIAKALATWSGDRSRILVATKGGLTRPQGRWLPDGRARHLIAACEASRRALQVERIALYQLHAPDPRTPLSTSVRALASLKRDGLIEHLGLCNVTVGQIEEARGIVDIAAVQVELNPWHDDNVLSGVAQYCIDNGIRLMAHRPLGGPERARRAAADAVLSNLAERHEATPAEIVLAWLMDLSDAIVPIAGATRTETAKSLVNAVGLRLTDADRIVLDQHFPSGQILRRKNASLNDRSPQRGDREIVLIMGLPGAGKTTAAEALVAQGYARLNRDDGGGSLRGLVPALIRLVESGASRIVLDNTYVSRKSRAPIVQAAAQAGVSVRCVWLSTTVEDAQVNAVSRMVSKYGRLIDPEEKRHVAKDDVSAFGPGVQFRYQRELEPPQVSEGFSSVEIVPFERWRDPSWTQRAVLFWCDGVLARSRSGLRAPASREDVDVFEQRAALLRRYAEQGWLLLGISWRPDIADGTNTIQQVDAVYARMQERLGVAIEVQYCPHAAGPPVCWCRKPLPGLGVVFINRHRLAPSQCVYVGHGSQDPGFARRLGFAYRDAEDFFA